ncbi:MAG: polysulfide reductase NrfD [Desulfitobacterium sp.]|nr:polysulfide reductase NrfD [Desulfitobacterium sp.]
MHLHWGWLIAIYLFLGGLGAGAYLTSYAADRGWLGNSPALRRAGYFMSGPIVAIGTLLLVFDLGQGLRKPWLLVRLVVNVKSSVMTWGVWILAFFIVVSLLIALLIWMKREVPAILTHVGAVLALATCAYTGLLLAVVEAFPLWNNYLLPVLFVVSALSTGLSITVLISNIIDKGLATDEVKTTKLHVYLVVLEVILIGVIFGMAAMGAKGVVAAESVARILTGEFAIWFWSCLIVLGLLVPFFVSVYALNKLGSGHSGHALSAATGSGASVAVGEADSLLKVMLLSDALVVLGGFVLRYVVVFAALPIWNGTLM